MGEIAVGVLALNIHLQHHNKKLKTDTLRGTHNSMSFDWSKQFAEFGFVPTYEDVVAAAFKVAGKTNNENTENTDEPKKGSHQKMVDGKICTFVNVDGVEIGTIEPRSVPLWLFNACEQGKATEMSGQTSEQTGGVSAGMFSISDENGKAVMETLSLTKDYFILNGASFEHGRNEPLSLIHVNSLPWSGIDTMISDQPRSLQNK